MTYDEKESKLNGFPFYATDALADQIERGAKMAGNPMTENEVYAAAEKQVEEMIGKVTEKELRFFSTLILYGERMTQRRLAGVLVGMTAKARKEWIEENAQ